MMLSQKFLVQVLSVAVAGLLMGFSQVIFAGDSEQTKLQALQRALAAPQESDDEFSPKAIIFEKDAANTPSAAPAPQRVASAGDCSLLPADVRTTAVDFQIQFKVGSAELSPVSVNTLQQIAKILALTPERCVFVEGHTDVSGNSETNLRLSKDRADSVVRFITDRAGVLRSRLITVGKGSSETLQGMAPTDPRNRRVVFKVAG